MPSYGIDIPGHVVVTGTGSGLGLDCAKALIAIGVHVIGVDVSPEPQELIGPQYRHARGSVADEALWAQVAETVREIGPQGPADGLGFIGAAAILEVGTLRTDTAEVWRRSWEVNVLGNVLALQALLPLLELSERSAAVIVTSVDAQFGEEQLAAYSSSKAAISGAVRSIALDFARSGITINLLAPGPMRAGLFERHLAASADPAAFLATREARQPIGRIVGADEVAAVALFLLSNRASAIFGSTVTADGGLTAGFDFRGGETAVQSS
ncbi:SDR family NAD(P)-dependent oxidoreductase [Subtercola boreus]|uniref:SDR family NAD(P)-dependent oxidoreductase n=1 Tax=Subtercola boreus TaxID=120213 RepID=UPI0015589E6F|nr:SDR family oxidoreductase [Subtercola boreus]